MALVILLFVLLTNFLLRAIDRFLGKGLPFGLLVEYLFLNLAWIVALAVPMAVLVATLMAFGRMAADNEITALRTAGLSYTSIIQPALIFGTAIFVGLLYFTTQILPDANHSARLLSSDINRKRPDLAIEPGYFVDDLPAYAMLAKTKEGDVFRDIVIYSKNNRNNQVTIFADRGTMETIDDAVLLNLEDGEIHELILPKRDEYRRLLFKKHRIVMPVDNLFFDRRNSANRGDREMDIPMMKRKILDYYERIQGVKRKVIQRLEREIPYPIEGDTTAATIHAHLDKWEHTIADSALAVRDSLRLTRQAFNLRRGAQADWTLIASYNRGVNRYWVEIHKKISIPFACIMFVLVGAPVGIISRRGGFVVAFFASLGFFFLYWALLIAGEELADRNLLNPVWAMWGPNIALAILGVALLIKIQAENRVSSRIPQFLSGLFRDRRIQLLDESESEQS